MENLQPGTMLQNGKFRIVSILGQGGFGITYLAEHTMLAKKFAIKEFFPKDFCNRDEATAQITVGTQSKKALVEKLKRKFTDEARALCRLSHPGIVSVTDVFEENGTAYFVMDYVEGRSLSDMLKIEGPMSEARAVDYIRQIALALQYVHNNNRLHLDVKPANIMVDKNDHAVLIDFGASKQYDEESGENTSTLMGKTPGYAPIEQMANDVHKFTPATDIYALGASLYKLLTGVTPPSAGALASGEEIKPLPAKVSQAVKKAVYAAMEIKVSKRPQSISEFLAILDVPLASTGSSEDESTIMEDEKTKINDIGSMPLQQKSQPVLHERTLDAGNIPPMSYNSDEGPDVEPPRKNYGKVIVISSILLIGLIIASIFLITKCDNTENSDELTALEKPDSNVSDIDNILTEDEKLSLIGLNDTVSAISGYQIVSFIIKNSHAEDFKSFNDSLFNAWGIGDSIKNNGILIGLDVDNHQIAITVGTGIDRSDTYWQSICDLMTPYCEKGDYFEALKIGTVASGERLDMETVNSEEIVTEMIPEKILIVEEELNQRNNVITEAAVTNENTAEQEQQPQGGIQETVVNEVKPAEDNKVYNIALIEEQPSFPGGESAMYAWIGSHISYPPVPAELGIQGRVNITFTVEKNGTISSVKAIRGPHPDLNREAERVVKAMPRWIPGKNNSHPVRVSYVLPINFKLSQ